LRYPNRLTGRFDVPATQRRTASHVFSAKEAWSACGSELGDLERLGKLDVSNNQLIGPVPPEIGNLGQLKILRVNDTLLSGRLPLELTRLPLEVFTWDGTDLCAPDDDEFREWLKSMRTTSGPDC